MESLKKFHSILGKHRRIAIDSSIFIYKFEQHSVYEKYCSTIFDKLSNNQIHLITSSITVSEILIKPFEKNDHETINLYENLFHSLPHFTIVDIDYSMAKSAAIIRSKYHILLPDAYQFAAAIKEKATIFITNDIRLKKLQKVLQIACLKDFE